ncbi:MAG TPA: hypothetical protein VJL29_08755 [Thermoguttaceae bacterium]|nr:hypothetical protein [Thermoguttaceae bacterium]
MTPDSLQPDPTADAAPLDEQLVAYLDGELDADTARRIETLAADDPRLRERLGELGRAWELLDQLDRPETAGAFTETTLELVAVQAEEEARQREAQLPRLRRRRLAMAAGGLLACVAVGFLGGSLLRGDPNRALLDDLPVIENVDEYLQVLGEDDRVEPSLDFLRRLDQEGVFGDESQPGEGKNAS